MARADAPFGFKPVRALHGGDIAMDKGILSSASVRVFKGDVLDEQASTGLLIRRIASSANNVAGVAAKNSGVLSGQVTDFPYYSDPDIVYYAQANNTASLTQAKFLSAYRVGATSGSTTLDHSQEEVDIATAANSVSHVVRALRIADVDGNDLTANTMIECILAGDPTEVAR